MEKRCIVRGNMFIVTLLTFNLIACSNDSKDQSAIITLVKENQAKWEAADLQDYMFDYDYAPSDCPTIDTYPVRTITVEDGKVVSATTVLGEETNLENQPTVDTIFAHMIEQAQQAPETYAASLNEKKKLPEFHPTLGYPTSYYVDKSSKDCDGIQVSIINFK